MARFNEILVGRFNRFMQKFLSMKGSASVVSLSDEIRAVIPLYNGQENRYLDSWQRFGSVAQQNAVGAQFSFARFRNPVGSNVVAVIEKLYITNQNATADLPQIYFGYGVTTDRGNLVVNNRVALDTRGQTLPTCILSNDTNASSTSPITSSLGFLGNPVNTTNDFIFTDDQELTLFPGAAMEFRNNVVNLILTVGFIWRERFLEESERT